MGNKHNRSPTHHHRSLCRRLLDLVHHRYGLVHPQLQLDRPNVVYLPGDTVSGTVSCPKRTTVFVELTGVIKFQKHKKEQTEICTITFFSVRSSELSGENQRFDLHLNEHLPPSFNQPHTFPHICFSVNLIYGQHTPGVHSSLSINVCPRAPLHQPLLLKPLFFGPIQNTNYGVTLEIKANRAAFVFGDTVESYFELHNERKVRIHRIQISIGIYTLVESNLWHADICQGIEKLSSIGTTHKLIRHKMFMTIPDEHYLPPTFKFKHGIEGDKSAFNLSIDYKLQVRIYLGEEEDMWQVDMPVVLCDGPLKQLKDDTKLEFSSATNVDD